MTSPFDGYKMKTSLTYNFVNDQFILSKFYKMPPNEARINK